MMKISHKKVLARAKALAGYHYLVFFSMLYMSIMLFNAILANRYIALCEHVVVLGGAFTTPLFFILGDVIAEVYGHAIAKQLILCGFLCQALFALVCDFVIHSSTPSFFNYYYAYSLVFGPLLYINISLVFAFYVSKKINTYIITKWKVLVQGQYFWLRSLGASTIADAFYSVIAIVMIEFGLIPLASIYKLILASYLIKVVFTIIFAWPTSLLVSRIKRIVKVDVHDLFADYNPFSSSCCD